MARRARISALISALPVAACALAFAAATAGAAAPGHASNGAGGISYTSPAGKASTITVGLGAASVRITDSAADPIADDGCVVTGDPHTVACDQAVGSFGGGIAVNVDAG